MHTDRALALRRSGAIVAMSVGAAVVGAGCAFQEGDPWGRATLEVSASLDTTGRGRDGGWIATSDDYLVRLDRLTFDVRDVVLSVTPFGEATGFDPADPPEGYGLCHNGHCHRDDGALVDYADIAAELGVGSSGSDVTVPVDVELTAAGEGAGASRTACEGGCDLPRGRMTAVSVELLGVRLVGEVVDLRRGSPAAEASGDGSGAAAEGSAGGGAAWGERLPGGRRAFDLVVPFDAAVAGATSTRVDRGEPVDVAVAARLVPAAALLDGVDWNAPDTDAWAASIRHNTSVAVTVTSR